MTAYLSGIKFCGKDGSNALICGYAKAVESGKKYCLKYIASGDTHNLHNKYYNYTFFSGPGDYNLTSSGCYIPNIPNGDYTIILEEVGETCEHFIDFVDSANATVYDEAPPAETRWLSVASNDLSGSRIPNVGFRLKNLDTGTSDNYSTDSSGYFERELTSGNYQLYPTVPAGYSAVSASYTVWLVIDQYIVIEFDKEEDPQCTFNINVKDTESQLGVSGADVKIESAQGGTFTGVTNSSGILTVNIPCGYTYHITARKDGYEDFGLFKDASEGTIYVSLPITKVSLEPCPAASAYFTIDRTTAGIGEYINTIGRAHHNDKYQSHTWDWGDGITTTGPDGQHKYESTGSYTLVHNVENECGSIDSITYEKDIVITGDAAHTLVCPDKVYVDIPFDCIIRSDPGREFRIVSLFLTEYGIGSTDGNGRAQIKCVVDTAGSYKVYGMSEGPGYDDYLIQTNDVEFNAVTEQPPDPDPDDPTGGFKLTSPTFAMADSEIEVSGTHPIPGQAIDIKIDKGYAVDPVIGTAFVQGDGSFKTTIMFDEFCYNNIYAYDPTWVEEWFPDIIPDGWIPGQGIRSNSCRVIVFTWTIVVALVVAIGIIIESKYKTFSKMLKR